MCMQFADFLHSNEKTSISNTVKDLTPQLLIGNLPNTVRQVPVLHVLLYSPLFSFILLYSSLFSFYTISLMSSWT